LHKGAVYSRTTTWAFRAGPLVGLSAVLIALEVIPLGNIPALLAFPGDVVFFAYLLGLLRFFTIIAALDTGSSFEGMGASREATYAALTEPALFLVSKH
jgi:formate hydrogenlyase subunit 4